MATIQVDSLGETVSNFSVLVQNELQRARKMNAPMHSAHEAYSVILEELDEFWEEVRKKRKDRDPKKMGDELIQIAAMVQRAAEDLGLL